MRYFSAIFLKQALMLIVLLLSLALVGCSKNNDGGGGGGGDGEACPCWLVGAERPACRKEGKSVMK